MSAESKVISLRATQDDIERWAAEAKHRGQTVSDLLRDSTNASVSLAAETLTRAAREVAYVTDPCPYTFSGASAAHSFVRDAFRAGRDDDRDARDRLDRFMRWQKDMGARFTTISTANASQVIPPGYRPLLADFTADRPLYAAATRQDLSDGTPFVLPGDLSDTSVGSGVSPHTEGTNPTDGSMVFGSKTVNPSPISGLFKVTREIVDSSNPAIDSIAFAAMREDYARQAETLIYTELNTVQSGTITAGLVPSGAQARTSTGTALPGDLRKAVLAFTDVRKARPRSVVASSRSTVAEALDGVGGATPVPGVLDVASVPAGSEDFAVVGGCGVRLSPYITGTAAGDGDVFILRAGDLYAWQSPLFQFTYRERSGPALVELAAFGYFATKVIKPSGVASIRHT